MCMRMDLTYTIMWYHCAEHVLTDEDQLRKTTLAQLTPMPDAQAFLDAQAVEPVTTLVLTSAHIKSRTGINYSETKHSLANQIHITKHELYLFLR